MFLRVAKLIFEVADEDDVDFFMYGRRRWEGGVSQAMSPLYGSVLRKTSGHELYSENSKSVPTFYTARLIGIISHSTV